MDQELYDRARRVYRHDHVGAVAFDFRLSTLIAGIRNGSSRDPKMKIGSRQRRADWHPVQLDAQVNPLSSLRHSF
jgi:hypothetical protein